MSERELCECDDHGPKPMAFVCNHIPASAGNSGSVGFVCYPGPDDDGLTDAWCDACEAFLQAHGGEWVEDEVEVPGGLAILCSECYLNIRAQAQASGKLRVL